MLQYLVANANFNKFFVYDENGEPYSHFETEQHYGRGETYSTGDRIVGSSKYGLYCYDFLGRILWEVHDCYPDDPGQVIFNTGGRNHAEIDRAFVYISYSRLRSDTRATKLSLRKLEPPWLKDAANMTGDTSEDYDLCFAKVDLDGAIVDFVLLEERCKSQGGFRIHGDRILLKYMKGTGGPNSSQGYFVLDKDLRLLDKIEISQDLDCTQGYTFGVRGDTLFYWMYDINPHKFDFTDEKHRELLGARLCAYNLKTKEKSEIASMDSGRRFSGSHGSSTSLECGGCLFFRSADGVYRVGAHGHSVSQHLVPNSELLGAKEQIVVAEMPGSYLKDYRRIYEEFIPVEESHFADGTVVVTRNFTRKCFGIPKQLEEEARKANVVKSISGYTFDFRRSWEWSSDNVTAPIQDIELAAFGDDILVVLREGSRVVWLSCAGEFKREIAIPSKVHYLNVAHESTF
jgi:hypothetical protein